EKTATVSVTLTFPYNAMNAVMKWLKDERLEIRTQQFDTECRLEVAVPLSKHEKGMTELRTIIHNQCQRI
ncbi:MAG: hypothetical protein LBF19_04785, partial [Prevotellaceae bacterium]|nr:hypothetical protein [Prevotellaceae bacterium]